MKPKLLKNCCITVIGKSWFDKVNGNSYFSAKVFVNNEYRFSIPYQYGHGTQYEHEAYCGLKARGLLPDCGSFWQACEKQGVKKLCYMIPNCKKSEVKEFGNN